MIIIEIWMELPKNNLSVVSFCYFSKFYIKDPEGKRVRDKIIRGKRGAKRIANQKS